MLTARLYTREKDGQIHKDSAAKRVTALVYLNPENDSFSRQEGCLRLLNNPDDLENYAVEVPPTRGTLLVFPNGPTTWHGHRQFVGPRHSVQLNYMTNDTKAPHRTPPPPALRLGKAAYAGGLRGVGKAKGVCPWTPPKDKSFGIHENKGP